MELNKIYNEDCVEGMKRIPDESIDCILTDPPYQYLKNQKLDIPFDEEKFFNEVKRVLKPGGFIVMFGRGTAFYRWNTMLADLGFTFKEEIVWDKRYSTSPLLPLHRVHETISLHCKGKGKINKVKVPYVEMKQYDIESIIDDIKKLRVVLNNPEQFKKVYTFLENNILNKTTEGKNNKKVVRIDRKKSNNFSKYSISISPTNKLSGAVKENDRLCSVVQAIIFGMNEKSIIRQVRDHYNTIHPTQKPVRLLERLLNLVCDENALVLDPFTGSGSTAVACINTGRNYIGFEIYKEYFDKSQNRIQEVLV